MDWSLAISSFAGQLDDYHAIPDAKLLGFRLTAQPLPYLSLVLLEFSNGGEGRSESLTHYGMLLKVMTTLMMCDLDKSNQIAGFDARLNLNHWFGVPLAFMGNMSVKMKSGFFLQKNVFGRLDYSSQLKNMPFQLYTEWADTRTNGDVQGISYNHLYLYRWLLPTWLPFRACYGRGWSNVSLGGDIRFDVMNRLNGRVMLAKVNQSTR
jgi:hypothetical protein